MRYMSHTLKRKVSETVNEYGEKTPSYAPEEKFWGALIPTRSRYVADGNIYTLVEANMVYVNGTLAKGDLIDDMWKVDFINAAEGVDTFAVLVALAQ